MIPFGQSEYGLANVNRRENLIKFLAVETNLEAINFVN